MTWGEPSAAEQAAWRAQERAIRARKRAAGVECTRCGDSGELDPDTRCDCPAGQRNTY